MLFYFRRPKVHSFGNLYRRRFYTFSAPVVIKPHHSYKLYRQVIKIKDIVIPNKKSVTTSSIHANQITADKIEIRNDESGILIPWLIGGVGVVMLAIGVFGLWRERKNKGA